MMRKKINPELFIFFVISILIILSSCSVSRGFKKINGIDDCYLYNNHTYFYIKHKTNWYDAKSACEAAEGHLLISNNEKENDFIKKIIDANTWLGLTDVENEGFWRWVDNRLLMWSDWAEGEPNNGGTENYAHYNAQKNFLWNDTNRRNEFYFICEIERKIRDLTELQEKRTIILNTLLELKATHRVPLLFDIQGCYQYVGHTYIVCDVKTNWKTAKAACENSGGHLLILETMEENNFIKKIIDELTWFGLTDEKNEAVWRWINGELLTFSDWASGQPDNNQELEHYAHYTPWSEYYNWNDAAFTNEYKFICEYDFKIEDSSTLIQYKTTLMQNCDLLLEK
ncbi:MAG: hypothetical protein JXJ04_17665 [Spirochaetales bacterium]|nr:hypothetical protein [Spirochaetales bacterium]